MHRTKYRNRFLKTRSNGDKEANNKQQIYCTSFIRKTKQGYYNSRSLWKWIKRFFSSESSNFNKVTLVEKDLTLEKNEDIAETINRIPLLIVIKLMTELGTRL